MESLLDVKVCLHCGAPFAFRLSRFGCVFTCPCGECIDAVKAAALFAANLRSSRCPPAAFVPIISSSVSDLTSSLKVAQVEMDVEREKVVVELRNFSSAEVAHLLGCFSLAVRENVRCEMGTRFTASIGLLDALVVELREAAEDPQLLFFVNPPAADLRGAVNQVAFGGLDTSLMDNIPAALLRVLKKHQLEAVRKALQLRGRILFADDMGVGKTLEAVATVAALQAYPLLILCPSAVKFMWADQMEQYLHEQVRLDEIHIISGSNDALDRNAQPKVVVTSYHMAAALESQLLRRRWQCVVCDESHVLHTNTSAKDATYTRTAIAIGKRAPYCLLLSGTPALSSPFDMFNQIDVLRPGLLGVSRYDFAMRYCHIIFTPFLRVGESTRRAEVSSLLLSCCMIRRLKNDVLELPAKSRVVLRVTDRPSFSAHRGGGSEALYQQRYAASWRAKWSGIAEAVDYCCGKYSRVVLLAHHLELIDALMKLLQQRREAAVRIDGRVPPQQRGALLDRFHAGEVQVAVVGITACAVGISLAPAPCAVFCELPPDAAWMTQAEDRLHRPGQTGEVVVYYLLGVHSDFDAELFARLCRHVREVDSVVAQVGGGELPLSQVSRRATACLDAGREPELSAVDSTRPAVPMEEPLLFCVSKNTGRVHVRARDGGAFYTALLWQEANECVRQRRSHIWQQLDAFLTSLARHSPYQQRQICLSNGWFPADFRWSRQHRRAVQAKRTRYTKASMFGWGMWWEVRRQYFSNHFYFGPLRLVENTYAVCCLGCAIELLDCNASLGPLRPGSLCHVKSDADLFCSGGCREAFYFKRSSSAIRRTVAFVDRSICAYCHVDCEALCTALASTSEAGERLRVLQRLHPSLLEHPALCERVIAHPEPGSVWQADHITPVGSGGGEASLDNIQTLCILCHSLKTQEDLRQMRHREAASLPPAAALATTVSDASRNWPLSGTATRVSRRRATRSN